MNNDYELMLKAYEQSGGERKIFTSSKFPHLLLKENKILSSSGIEGLELNIKETKTGIKGEIRAKKGIKIPEKVHLCFGVIPEDGLQEILVNFIIEDGAEVSFLAHCTFPNSVKVKHIMKSEIKLGKDAVMEYSEFHYHGEKAGVLVFPTIDAHVSEKGKFRANFFITSGRVGKLVIRYRVTVEDYGLAELVAKAYGKSIDEVRFVEKIYLNGKYSRGLIKSRVALRDRAKGRVISGTVGRGDFCRGHVDCVEIVKDQADAKAFPVVEVTNDKAKVTHEAAIGRVDKKQLDTLMSRGLSEEEAVDVVVRGMMR